MFKEKKEKIKGFTLLYTVIIVSVIAIIVGIGVNSIIKETQISQDEGESLKAFYAADSGAECIKFFQENFRVMDPRSPQGTYTCQPGDTFTVGGDNEGGADCVAVTYGPFIMDDFSNGSCTSITIDVTPETIYTAGVPSSICRYYMESAGKNSCSSSGSKLVERTRWETF